MVMLVMFVVNMGVVVLEELMFMFVFVPLGQMEPQADAHECASRQ
jgi:hypothetical protein